MIRPARFALAICLLLATQCSFFRGIAGLKRPTISFKRVDLQDASLSGGTVALTYEVDNPNPFALPLEKVTYRVLVEGKPFFSGHPPAGQSVPANGRTELVLPAEVRFADLAPSIQALLTKDRLHYKVDGQVGWKSPMGTVSLPLSHEGDLEAPKVPQIALGNPRVSALQSTAMTLELPLQISNRNSFPLSLTSISGALKIAGQDVGMVATDKLSPLAPHEQQEISLPLTIQARGVTAVIAALRQGSGQLSFSGSVRSGQAALPVEWEAVRQFRR